MVVFGLGKNILFKSVLGHCDIRYEYFEDPLRFSTLVLFNIVLPKLDRKFYLTAFLTNIMSQLFEILTDCSAKLHKNVSTKYNYCVDWQHPNCDDNSK